jgi:hypothetical protein
MSAEDKTKLDNLDLLSLTNRVDILEIPANKTMVEKTVEQLWEEGKVSTNPNNISRNTLHFPGADWATFLFGDTIFFSIENNTNVNILIDGNTFEGITYEG